MGKRNANREGAKTLRAASLRLAATKGIADRQKALSGR
jgi:hypothetical protein